MRSTAATITLYCQGENDPGYLPESDNHWTRSAESAVQSLGEEISRWADSQYDLPEDQRDDETDYAASLVEILRGARCAEYHDILEAVRDGGVSYTFDNRVYWIDTVPVSADRAQDIMGCRCEDYPCCGCE